MELRAVPAFLRHRPPPDGLCPDDTPGFLFMADSSVAHSESSKRLGHGAAWQKYRAGYLRSHPFCVMCEKWGSLTAATVVDHIEPHKGDQQKFWDPTNHQSLCKPCHDAHKQRFEKSGGAVGCDVGGMPIDPNHHWHKH